MATRHVIQGVLAAVALTASTQALALSCDEIMNMYNVNVPVNIIVQTMENSGDQFTSADIQCLAEAGADQAIVAAARKMSASDEPETAPGPDTDPDPEPSAFDSAEELGSGRGDELPEATDEDDADQGANPAKIETLIKLYRAKKYLTASKGFYDLLEDGSFPDQESKLHYYLAKCLFDLHMYHSAQHYFMQVVRRGPRNPYFKYALPKLVAIAQFTGNNYELMRIVHKIPPDAFPRKAQNHLYYLMGLKLYENGELASSAKYFSQISSKSNLYLRAKYIEGEINNERGKLKSAVRSFRDVYQADVSPRDERELKEFNDLKDLSLVNIARIYYGLQRFENSTSYYSQVDRNSSYWPTSIYERAWSSFLQNELNQTLGLLLTVHSPYYSQDEYLPEATYLRALTYFQLCEFDEAERILLRFEDTYQPMRAEMKAFLSQYNSKEGQKLADQAFEAYFEEDHDESTLSKNLFLRVLRNRELSSLVTHMDMMADEDARIDEQKSAWRDSIGAHLKKVIDSDRQRYKKKAGAVLLKEMSRQYADLGDLMAQSQIVRFEIVDAQRIDYEFRMSNIDVESEEDRTVDYAVSRTIIYWPFNGEYWEDELGFYRYTEHGSCR